MHQHQPSFSICQTPACDPVLTTVIQIWQYSYLSKAHLQNDKQQSQRPVSTNPQSSLEVSDTHQKSMTWARLNGARKSIAI